MFKCGVFLCAQAKSLAVEMYKWLGAALKPSLEKQLKPVQVAMMTSGGGGSDSDDDIRGGGGAEVAMTTSRGRGGRGSDDDIRGVGAEVAMTTSRGMGGGSHEHIRGGGGHLLGVEIHVCTRHGHQHHYMTTSTTT